MLALNSLQMNGVGMPKITKKIPNITTHTPDFRNVVQKGCISIQIIWVGQLRNFSMLLVNNWH